MGKDELEYFRNYQDDPMAKHLLLKEIANQGRNYIADPDKQFIKIAYEYLSAESNLNGYEYRFLCWLNFNFDLDIKLNLPSIESPKLVNLFSFKESYLFSDRRHILYESLLDYIKGLKERTQLKDVFVLIGGSFTDTNVDAPNDIDIAILTPCGFEDSDEFNENYQPTHELIPEGVDMVFLPEELKLSSFKVFSRIMCLGNKADFTDKMGKSLTNNSFVGRDILKLKL